MKTPAVVSPQEWEAARLDLLVKEKEVTRAGDVLAADRRRMPWVEVEEDYEFDGPQGSASLLDLFAGRRQLIVYRAFYEPGERRRVRYRLRSAPMQVAQQFLAALARDWDGPLDALKDHLSR